MQNSSEPKLNRSGNVPSIYGETDGSYWKELIDTKRLRCGNVLKLSTLKISKETVKVCGGRRT